MVTTEALSPVWQELIPSLAQRNSEPLDSFVSPNDAKKIYYGSRSILVDPLFDTVTLPIVTEVKDELLRLDKPVIPDTQLAFRAAQQSLKLAKSQPDFAGRRIDKLGEFITRTTAPVLTELGFEYVFIDEDNMLHFTYLQDEKEVSVMMDLTLDTRMQILNKGDYNSFMLYGGFKDAFSVQDRLQRVRKKIAFCNADTQILYLDIEEARRQAEEYKDKLADTEIREKKASWNNREQNNIVGNRDYITVYDDDATQSRIPLPIYEDYRTVYDPEEYIQTREIPLIASKDSNAVSEPTRLMNNLKGKVKNFFVKVKAFSKKIKLHK